MKRHQPPTINQFMLQVVVFTASGFYFSTGGAFGGEIDDTPSDTFEAVVEENLRIAYLSLGQGGDVVSEALLVG